MYPALLFAILGAGLTVNAGNHSLYYIYTAFSKPVELPGIHEFTAMGLLDGKMIDYYDSEHQTKVPKQNWMAERLEKDYWVKGTQSRKSKEQWFKVNIDTLMKRMRQNNTDTHVLQWMHGCVGSGEVDETLTFVSGMDSYIYDGNDFLSFDYDNQVWVTTVTEALETKRKWDDVAVLKDYTKGYLKEECIQWLSKFMKYEEEQLTSAKKPDVFLFAKKANDEANAVLTCLATGFYSKDTIVTFRRNGLIINGKEGVQSSGVRPNEDDTFQIRNHMEILKSDSSIYTCQVKHEATKVDIEYKWDGKVKEPENETTGSGVIVGGVIVVLLLLLAGVVVGLLIFLKKRKAGSSPSPSISTISIPSNAQSDIYSRPDVVVEPLLHQNEDGGSNEPTEEDKLTNQNGSEWSLTDSGVSSSNRSNSA